MKYLAAALWGLLIGALISVGEAPPPQAQAAPPPHKSVVTEAMEISAGFYATGSPYWNGGIHSGVDYAAPEGSPVFVPFDCAYTMTGFYSDPGRYGEYLMCTLPDGYEYYSGHLQGVQPFGVGQVLPAGTLIGWTNALAHTHVQLRSPSGEMVDFAEYWSER